MNILRRIITIGLLIYGLVLYGLYEFQEYLVFNLSSAEFTDEYTLPAGTELVWLERPDGARLEGAVFRAETERLGAVLYFRGNAGNLQRTSEVAGVFTKLGFDVLTMDYRQFGRSTGDLSEEAMLADAEAWYDEAVRRFPNDEIRVVGYSLGTTFASHVASAKPVKDLALLAPMQSVLELAQRRYPFVPAFVSRYPLRTDLKLASDAVKERVRILAFHGDKDKVVPLASGIGLKAAFTDDDSFTIVEGADHNELPFRSEVAARIHEKWQ